MPTYVLLCEIFRLWANQTQAEARSQKNTARFKGPTLWSYSVPIATIVAQAKAEPSGKPSGKPLGLPSGKPMAKAEAKTLAKTLAQPLALDPIYLLNSGRFSPTTNKHITFALHVAQVRGQVISVPNVLATSSADHSSNLAALYRTYISTYNRARRARTLFYPHVTKLKQDYLNLQAYAKLFSLAEYSLEPIEDTIQHLELAYTTRSGKYLERERRRRLAGRIRSRAKAKSVAQPTSQPPVQPGSQTNV